MAPLQFGLALATALTSAAANGISAGYCRALDGSGFNSSIFYLNKRSVGDAAAVCNDGSPAQMYFRPCCDGETAGDFCNESAATWVVVFGEGNEDGWCWDAESCAERAAASPMLTSSEGLPQFWSRFGSYWEREVGAFSKGGETNQNFYKSYAAYVPYCSSDLFLGDCEGNGDSSFCGRSIARAAVRNLLPEMAKYGADRIFLVGGAGIMTYLEELRSLLPASAEVRAVCDGCVLLDGGAGGGCSGADAFSCAPKETLPQAVELWQASLPQDCQGWKCLTSSATEGAIALAASAMPVLAQHPLYDRLAVAESSPVAVRDAVVAALSAATVAVGGGCAAPQSSFTRPEFFSVRYGGGLPPLTYASALLSIANEQPLQLVDSCDGVDCNPSCNTTALAAAADVFFT